MRGVGQSLEVPGETHDAGDRDEATDALGGVRPRLDAVDEDGQSHEQSDRHRVGRIRLGVCHRNGGGFPTYNSMDLERV